MQLGSYTKDYRIKATKYLESAGYVIQRVSTSTLVEYLFTALRHHKRIPVSMELPYPLYKSQVTEWLVRLCKFIPTKKGINP